MEADKNGKYFVKIYTNGPSGRGAPFPKLNAVAKAFASIIDDERIVQASVAPAGTTLKAQNGETALLAPSPLGSPAGTFVDSRGQLSTVLLNSAPGYVPGNARSDGRNSTLDTGLVIAHELGHVEYAWRSALGHLLMLERTQWNRRDSDANGIRLENQVRTMRGGPTRTIHNFRTPGGVLVFD